MVNYAMKALAASALHNIPLGDWRQHGIGVLQAYVRENVEPEVRIHVWHPSLVRPGILECGSIHDHRFELESHVLHGKLYETVYTPAHAMPWGTPVGRMQVWDVQNARAAGAERGFDGVCKPAETPSAEFVSSSWTHLAGSSYRLHRGGFHETRVDDLAVTVCVMQEKRGQAHLLVPEGKEPVHAFGEPVLDRDGVLDLLRQAREALSG